VLLSDVQPDQSMCGRLSCAASFHVVQRRPATERPPRAPRPRALPPSPARHTGCGSSTCREPRLGTSEPPALSIAAASGKHEGSARMLPELGWGMRRAFGDLPGTASAHHPLPRPRTQRACAARRRIESGLPRGISDTTDDHAAVATASAMFASGPGPAHGALTQPPRASVR
jgi:hypothetical protein